MEAYLLGCGIALLLGLWRLIVAVSHAYSPMAHNFAHIEQYYSLGSGQFDAEDPPSVGRILFYAAYLLLLAPLGSWLSVLSVVVGYIHVRTRYVDLPEPVKHYRFVCANFRMPKARFLEEHAKLGRAMGDSDEVVAKFQARWKASDVA